MITETNIDNLYRIASNLSYRDFISVNKGKEKFHPYSLSQDTLEALDFLLIANREKINKEQEEKVKAYLLKIKFSRPELLTETNGNYEQWHNFKS